MYFINGVKQVCHRIISGRLFSCLNAPAVQWDGISEDLLASVGRTVIRKLQQGFDNIHNIESTQPALINYLKGMVRKEVVISR